MSEPQRRSFDEATEGQEPGAGIADAATVEGGTVGSADRAAHASEQQVDPGGFPHEPAPSVPPVPTDAGDGEDGARGGRQDGSRGPGPA
ncbi:MAG: hypothetical protein ACLGIV_05560 [Actinomycetes bacterium]